MNSKTLGILLLAGAAYWHFNAPLPPAKVDTPAPAPVVKPVTPKPSPAPARPRPPR